MIKIRNTEICGWSGNKKSRTIKITHKKDIIPFDILQKLDLAQLGEYLPYRFETLREKALKEELAQKEALIEKMETQLEVFRKMNRK